MAKIVSVNPQGVLYKKVKVGDIVTAFDERPFEDILDYIFADGNMTCKVSLIDNKNQKYEVIAEKDFGGDTLGLEFDDSVEISPRECHNNCMFCFVNQLPKGLRETLYIKDDDYRLSFISGSYITCTNLSKKDIQRIIDYKLSPLYVSVHCTDEEIRKQMLGIKKSNNQMDIIKLLTSNGIDIHSQIVLVPNVNDGNILQQSLEDLYNAGIKTVAIVPVGLSAYREGLPEIKPFRDIQAINAIKIIELFYDSHPYFCYASDEMYEIANEDVKDASYYGDYAQIENGVGLVAKFLDEIAEALEYAPKKVKKTVGIITGVSGLATMEKTKEMLCKKWKKLKINIYPIKNTFFGETVTVSGLVTATDILKELGSKVLTEDEFIIPSVMLKEFESVFLDGTSIEELKQKLNKKLIVSAVTGECFVDTIVYGE